MAITDLQAAQEMAAKHPDLHESRQIAFGENYLQDLAQGTGTSQYYTGFGLAPDWVTGAIGAPAEAPVVQDPMAGDAQVAEQIAAQDRSAPVVQDPSTMIPQLGSTTMDQAAAIEAMTQPEAYNIPGEMPQTPAPGMVWGPQDYLQRPQTILQDPMTGDASIAELIAAEDRAAAAQKPSMLGDVGFNMEDIPEEEKQGLLEKLGNVAKGITSLSPVKMLLDQIGPASGMQQEAVKDQFVEEGVTLDDIGRIQRQKGLAYDTPENIMAGYAPGATGLQIGDVSMGGGIIQESIVDRLSDLEKTKNEKYDGSFFNEDGSPKINPDSGQPTTLGSREKALIENLNMVARAAGAVTLDEYDPGGDVEMAAPGAPTTYTTPEAGYTTYATDYFPDLGVEETAPIDDIDEGFQTRFTAKDEGTWKGPGTASKVADITPFDPDRIADSTVKVGKSAQGTIDRTIQAEDEQRAIEKAIAEREMQETIARAEAEQRAVEEMERAARAREEAAQKDREDAANRAAAERAAAQAAAAKAAADRMAQERGGGGGGFGKGRDPGGGAAGSPFARGGRVRYSKGGIVDLL